MAAASGGCFHPIKDVLLLPVGSAPLLLPSLNPSSLDFLCFMNYTGYSAA